MTREPWYRDFQLGLHMLRVDPATAGIYFEPTFLAPDGAIDPVIISVQVRPTIAPDLMIGFRVRGTAIRPASTPTR